MNQHDELIKALADPAADWVRVHGQVLWLDQAAGAILCRSPWTSVSWTNTAWSTP